MQSPSARDYIIFKISVVLCAIVVAGFIVWLGEYMSIGPVRHNLLLTVATLYLEAFVVFPASIAGVISSTIGVVAYRHQRSRLLLSVLILIVCILTGASFVLNMYR